MVIVKFETRMFLHNVLAVFMLAEYTPYCVIWTTCVK